MRPTLGYDNYVLTVWFKQLIKKEPYPYSIPPAEELSNDSIFVGI